MQNKTKRKKCKKIYQMTIDQSVRKKCKLILFFNNKTNEFKNNKGDREAQCKLGFNLYSCYCFGQ